MVRVSAAKRRGPYPTQTTTSLHQEIGGAGNRACSRLSSRLCVGRAIPTSRLESRLHPRLAAPQFALFMRTARESARPHDPPLESAVLVHLVVRRAGRSQAHET